jgi:hypothetical protein
VVVCTHEQALPIADGRPLIDLPTPPEDRAGAATMMEDRYGDLVRRGFDAPALLEGVHIEGVVAARFPSYGLHVPWADHVAPELAVGFARSYNCWIVSLCADGERRQLADRLRHPMGGPSSEDHDREWSRAARVSAEPLASAHTYNTDRRGLSVDGGPASR